MPFIKGFRNFYKYVHMAQGTCKSPKYSRKLKCSTSMPVKLIVMVGIFFIWSGSCSKIRHDCSTMMWNARHIQDIGQCGWKHSSIPSFSTKYNKAGETDQL
jgi:hypothetical protein